MYVPHAPQDMVTTQVYFFNFDNKSCHLSVYISYCMDAQI